MHAKAFVLYPSGGLPRGKEGKKQEEGLRTKRDEIVGWTHCRHDRHDKVLSDQGSTSLLLGAGPSTFGRHVGAYVIGPQGPRDARRGLASTSDRIGVSSDVGAGGTRLMHTSETGTAGHTAVRAGRARAGEGQRRRGRGSVGEKASKLGEEESVG